MKSEALYADNSGHTSHDDETEASAGHGVEGDASAAQGESNVFSELFKDLGDHYGIAMGPLHVELPIILYDDGLHVYSSPTSMEAAGVYTMSHDIPHKVIRASDHQKPALDLSITNFVFFEWLAMILLFSVGKMVAGRYKKSPNKAPRGIQNLIEVFVIYIRDDIVQPAISSKRVANRLLSYFISLFFFILTLNLFGLIPGGHTATSGIGVTAGLGIIAFFIINITSLRTIGIGAWLHHLLGGAPWWLFWIMIPVEIIGLFAKPFALIVRLFANMTAGHIVLMSLVGLIFYFKTIFVAPVSVGFSLFVYALEVLVAFLQAYIFTMLTAVFVGLAIGHHGHDEEEAAHTAK